MADRAQVSDPFETAKGLFHDILVKVEREHFVLRQRTGGEDTGVAVKLFGLGQLGGQEVAPRVKESLQARLSGLALGEEFLSMQNLIAAKLASIALLTLIQTEGQLAGHAVQLVGSQAGVEDGVTHALPVGQLHELLRISPRAPELPETSIEWHPTQRLPVQMLDILDVTSRHNPSVVDEEARPQMVTAEERDQVLQGARVMHIAIEDLVEQGKAFLLGHS